MSNNIKAKITPQKNLLVQSIAINRGSIKLGDLSDIDVTAISDGAMLVYNGNNSVWEAKVEMKNNNTIFNGGFF